MTVTEELVHNIVQTSFESLDKDYVEKAKLRILDAIGCALGGANAAGCNMMLNLIRKWGGSGESTILVHGGKVPAHNAAMINSLMTRSFDFEPIEAEGENKSSPAHISGTTVPTALAMAEQQAASGQELITALVVGDDLASRLDVATGFDFTLGWDCTGTINMFGATAIAGKLLKLSDVQVFNSFGIALNQLSGSMAGVFDKTMSFKLPIALSSRNGIFSAELAKEGFIGVHEPFFGPRGYFSLFTRNANLDGLTKDIGRRYYADCIIKPYSACRANHAFIDCALELAVQQGVRAEDISKIIIRANPGVLSGFCGQPFILGETPQIDCAFSIRYTVACALLRKGVKPEYFSNEHIRDPRIKTLIDKMEFVPVTPPEKAHAAEIQVILSDNNQITANTDCPKGDFRRTPLSKEEIKSKFRSNVAYSNTISRSNSEKALNMIENLENLRDIRELTQLLQ